MKAKGGCNRSYLTSCKIKMKKQILTLVFFIVIMSLSYSEEYRSDVTMCGLLTLTPNKIDYRKVLSGKDNPHYGIGGTIFYNDGENHSFGAVYVERTDMGYGRLRLGVTTKGNAYFGVNALINLWFWGVIFKNEELGFINLDVLDFDFIVKEGADKIYTFGVGVGFGL